MGTARGAQGHKVCIASLELTTDYLFEFFAGQSACKPRFTEQYLRRFGQWADDKLFIVDHSDVMSPEEVITLIIDSKRLLGCDMFVLDCLMQVDHGWRAGSGKAVHATAGGYS